MLLGEPPSSQADIHFRLFGVPIRVHPWFWIISVLIGLRAEDPVLILLWVGAMFVSIVVHELGHAFTQRYFGGHPWITLYAMGGLSACDDCDRSPRSQILISLAGPVAGFLFAAVVLLGLVAARAQFAEYSRDVALAWWEEHDQVPIQFSVPFKQWLIEPFPSMPVNRTISNLLWINIWWGILNLMPIYPLDGGRVARELFTLRGNARQGIIRSLQLSIGGAIAVAVFGLLQGQLWMLLLFGYLAYLNYQTIQAYQAYDAGPMY